MTGQVRRSNALVAVCFRSRLHRGMVRRAVTCQDAASTNRSRLYGIVRFVELAMIILCMGLGTEERAHEPLLYRPGRSEQILSEQGGAFELRFFGPRRLPSEGDEACAARFCYVNIR